MGRVLLISDDLPRSERLARSLGPTRPCTVHDLYADAEPSGQPDLIVSDVARFTAEAIRRLLEVCCARPARPFWS